MLTIFFVQNVDFKIDLQKAEIVWIIQQMVCYSWLCQ